MKILNQLKIILLFYLLFENINCMHAKEPLLKIFMCGKYGNHFLTTINNIDFCFYSADGDLIVPWEYLKKIEPHEALTLKKILCIENIFGNNRILKIRKIFANQHLLQTIYCDTPHSDQLDQAITAYFHIIDNDYYFCEAYIAAFEILKILHTIMTQNKSFVAALYEDS